MDRKIAARIVGIVVGGSVMLTEPFTGWARGIQHFATEHPFSVALLVLGALLLLYGFADDVLMMIHIIRPKALRRDVIKLIETLGWIPENHPEEIARDFAWQVNATLKAPPDKDRVRKVINELSVLYNRKTKCLQIGVRMSLRPTTRAFLDGMDEQSRLMLLMQVRGAAATRGVLAHTTGTFEHTTGIEFQKFVWVSDGLDDAVFNEGLQACKSTWDAANDFLIFAQMLPPTEASTQQSRA